MSSIDLASCPSYSGLFPGVRGCGGSEQLSNVQYEAEATNSPTEWMWDDVGMEIQVPPKSPRLIQTGSVGASQTYGHLGPNRPSPRG